MIDQTRIVVDFLNSLTLKRRHRESRGPLAKALSAATLTQNRHCHAAGKFFWLLTSSSFSGPVLKRIAYSRPEAQVAFLMEQLGPKLGEGHRRTNL